MSFTPGPWKQTPVGTWIDTVGDPYGHGQMHIADVRGWGHLTGKGACALSEDEAMAIQDANARLIAAAPDLLACAKAVAERLAEVYRPEYVERAAARDPESLLGRCVRLNAAIAKAEGGAQ